MIGQSLGYVGCQTRHANGDAAVLIVETTAHTAMSCESILACDDTDMLVLLCFTVKEIIVKSSSNQRSDLEQRMVHDAGTSRLCN